VTTLLSVAGMAAEAQQHGAFVFAGFLSTKATERSATVHALASETRAIVLLEAPHRIEAMASALAVLGQRQLTVGRELTKQFEEISTISAADFPHWLKQDANRTRGEFVLVLHPVAALAGAAPEPRVLKLLLAELPLKTAVKLAAEITGESRNALYDLALSLRADA